MSTNRFGPKKPMPARAEVSDIFVTMPTKKLTVDLDAELHQRLKIASTMEGRPMRSIIEECLSKYLDK